MSQITQKFITNNAINGTKFRLDNTEMLRARNAANSADINFFRLTSGDKMEFQVLPEALSTLPIPTSAKQFATIEYITNYVQGKVDAKDAVNVLADTNFALTGSTTLTIDSLTVLNGWRVALTGQTTASQNGIYDATIAGANWTLVRSADFDQLNDASGNEVTQGAYFMVIQGTVYSGYEVILTTANPIVIGTTNLTFAKYPTAAAITGGDMIVKSGNDLAVDLLTNGGLVSSNPGNPAGQLQIKILSTTESLQTVKVDASGNVVAKKFKKSLVTLASGDITNQYVDLSDVAADSSVRFQPLGAGEQAESVDFSVNYTGGTSSKTRITFSGGLATAGVSALASGDQLAIYYGAY